MGMKGERDSMWNILPIYLFFLIFVCQVNFKVFKTKLFETIGASQRMSKAVVFIRLSSTTNQSENVTSDV